MNYKTMTEDNGTTYRVYDDDKESYERMQKCSTKSTSKHIVFGAWNGGTLWVCSTSRFTMRTTTRSSADFIAISVRLSTK